MESTVKKQIAIALAALGCSLAGTAAPAGNVQWSVGISAPPVATVISNGPAYAPVYAPAPVVYAPPPPVYVEEPVVYAPPPPRVVYRPVPVVVPAPVYYRPAPVVVYGGGYGGYYRTGHYHRGWRDHRDDWDDQTRRHH